MLHHCTVSLSKTINPSLVLVQPRKTRPFISKSLLMGRKESNQTKQRNTIVFLLSIPNTYTSYELLKLAWRIDVRSVVHGQVSLAAINQIYVNYEAINCCTNLKIC